MKGVTVPIPSWPWWILGGRKEKKSGSNRTDALKFPTNISPSKAEVKRQWIGRDNQEMVSLSDAGACSSCSDTDGPEWSVGWTEPHGPAFESNDEEGDGGFLVLVPCYRAVIKDSSSNHLLNSAKNLPNGISPGADGKNFMDQWLSSLQNHL